MRNFALTSLLLIFTLTACSISVSPNEVSPTPFFLTATLPVTLTPFPRPVTPSPTSITATVNPTLAACKERAVMLQDVTIPDNTYIAPGASFTKTWRFENSGACTWTGYTAAFASGDRMGAPDSVLVPTTASGATVDISLKLTAPTAYNSYAGYFVLNDQNGNSIPIGIYKNFWVKIIIGNVPSTTPLIATPSNGTPGIFPTRKPGNCQYSQNGSYINQLEGLINSARVSAGLSGLTMDIQISTAAQGHSVDMVCNNFLGHFGSDGSWIDDRLKAAGYNPDNGYGEIIAIGTPQDAMNQWKNDAGHWDFVLSHEFTVMGIGYAYNASSDYGGYYTVDFGNQ